MDHNQKRFDEIQSQIDSIRNQQSDVNKQLVALIVAFKKLKKEVSSSGQEASLEMEQLEKQIVSVEKVSPPKVEPQKRENLVPSISSNEENKASFEKVVIKRDLEKFIGENLINKIGIIITVIGLGIGAKYSIDHNLISPIARIILGYTSGLVLFGVGMKLKKNYFNYSAVLISGAIAVMYFMTFLAYDLYGLIPRMLAFVMMLVFTGFSIVTSYHYKKQVIAVIGLVGAYGLPFLLSDNSGNVLNLFIYVTVINVGILIVSFNKSWKALMYLAFTFTWMLFFGWFLFMYDGQINLALSFSLIFFLIFYAIGLMNKCVKSDEFEMMDLIYVLGNALIYYGIGYYVISSNENLEPYLGLFTLANAIIHFLVAVFIRQKKLVDQNYFYLTITMVMAFITMAIPVQLDGFWVTSLWSVEALMMFYFGRVKPIPVFEKMAGGLMFLAIISQLDDLQHIRFFSTDHVFFANGTFLTFLVSSLSFFGIYFTAKKHPSHLSTDWSGFFNWIAPLVALMSSYAMFYIEIAHFWNIQYVASEVYSQAGYLTQNEDFIYLKTISIILYSLVFGWIIGGLNLQRLKNVVLAKFNVVFNILCTVAFLVIGLFILSELRENYLDRLEDTMFSHGSINIWMRYVLVGVFVAMLFQVKSSIKQF